MSPPISSTQLRRARGSLLVCRCPHRSSPPQPPPQRPRTADSLERSAKRWLSFLHNHCEVIAAMDFFTTVPTRHIQPAVLLFHHQPLPAWVLHFNVPRHPTNA